MVVENQHWNIDIFLHGFAAWDTQSNFVLRLYLQIVCVQNIKLKFKLNISSIGMVNYQY